MEQALFLHALEPSSLSTEYLKMAVGNLDWGGGALLKRMTTVDSAEFNTATTITKMQAYNWRNFSNPISESDECFTFKPKELGKRKILLTWY